MSLVHNHTRWSVVDYLFCRTSFMKLRKKLWTSLPSSVEEHSVDERVCFAVGCQQFVKDADGSKTKREEIITPLWPPVRSSQLELRT